MKQPVYLIIFVGIVLFTVSCWMSVANSCSGQGQIYVRKNDDLAQVLAQDNMRYIIKYNHDLRGRDIVIGHNSVLDFQGGSIRAGRIIGNGCYIKGNVLFDHVNFTNSCRIDSISDIFISIVDEENLVDLFSLLNDDDFQVLEITKEYVTSTTEHQSHNYINLMSHSKIVLNGTITLGTTSADVSAYRVLLAAEKDDIEVCGTGALIGERETKSFVGTETYEHGVGIGIYNSTNIYIHDITITKMIGDGIYITSTGRKHTENVIISNTKITNNRRQGISLIAGNNIIIKNNYIGYTGGTQPEAAFDLEPNSATQTSKNVIFCDNLLENNNDGIHIHDKKAPAENVIIENNIASTRIAEANERDALKKYGGCNIVIANSGGSIRIKNQEMINLVVYKNTGKIKVDSCIIHQSLGFINTEDCSGSLFLNDCTMDRSIDLKQAWYTALIYTRKGAGELTNVEFNRCKFLSSTVDLFNTICMKEGCASRIVFNNCDIDVNSVLLCRSNSVFNRCNINCKRMKISLPSAKESLVMDGNTININSNNPAAPLLVLDTVSPEFEGNYNLVMRNNVFAQPLGQKPLHVVSGGVDNLRLFFENNRVLNSKGQQASLSWESLMKN